MTKLACLHDKSEMNSIAMSGIQNNIYSIVDKIELVKNNFQNFKYLLGSRPGLLFFFNSYKTS